MNAPGGRVQQGEIMKMRKKMLCLAVLGSAVGMAAPMSAVAGTVGYYKTCGASGDITGVVTATGHTTVNVATLDAASLAGLSALVITVCPNGYVQDADVDAAVANGMGLVFERLYFGGMQDSTQLPGAPTFSTSAVYAYPEADDIEVAAGAPAVISAGPGGTLTSTSLDRLWDNGPTYFNIVNWFPAASLPAGAIPFLTTSNPDHVGAFGYTSGAGRVVYTDSQWTLQITGGAAPNSSSFAAGGATFLSNAIAWVAGPSTTCASEGYTGTKLEWCKNICERGYTGGTLAMWIRRWTDRYRTLPYCAVDTK
jgi:hypothetical protein